MKVQVITESGNVYLRTGPGKEYDSIGSLIRNSVYTAVSKTNGWYFVVDGEDPKTGCQVSGYASGDYLVPYEEPEPTHDEEPEPEPTPQIVVMFTRDELEDIYEYIGGLLDGKLS